MCLFNRELVSQPAYIKNLSWNVGGFCYPLFFFRPVESIVLAFSISFRVKILCILGL